MRKFTILVTGGAGFIGSHLVDRLLADNHRVICFDNFDSFYNPVAKFRNVSRNVDNPLFKLVSGNVTDPISLGKAFSCWKLDAVVHLAAQAGVRPSVQNPNLHFDVNVNGTVNVLEFCRKNEVDKFVFASSSSVYGNTPHVPFSEEDNTDHPLCPYAASKKAGELACYNYHSLYGLDVACIRPFTVYGPRQRLDMAIPLFTRSIYDQLELIVHGGKEVYRDFTYVDDVVSGILRILSRDHGYEIYNIGSGVPIGLKALIDTLEKLLDKKAVTKQGKLGEGEATRTYADITKAKEKLGYAPQYNIESGLTEFVNWFLEDRRKFVS